MSASKAVYRHYAGSAAGWYYVDEGMRREYGPYLRREDALAGGPGEFVVDIVASWAAMPQRLLA